MGLIPENELSKKAGIEIDRRTSGAVVYENMETSAPGIFACGNVLHVHDLVDFVTAESQRAGAAAAEYIQGSGAAAGRTLELAGGDGITYTVPQKIRFDSAVKNVNVFFRVTRICANKHIRVRSGGEEIAHYKREHLAPGEMEHIAIPKVLLQKCKADRLDIAIREVFE